MPPCRTQQHFSEPRGGYVLMSASLGAGSPRSDDVGRVRALPDMMAALPKAFRYRLYVDQSAATVPGMEDALETLADNTRFQVVVFRCPDFAEDAGHRGRFGEIMKMHPLFQRRDACRADVVCLVDFRAWYTPEWAEHVLSFRRGRSQVMTVVPPLLDGPQVPDDGRVWLTTWGTALKVRFPSRAWRDLRHTIEGDRDLVRKMESLDWRNWALGASGESLLEMARGADEVFLNHRVSLVAKRESVRVHPLRVWGDPGPALRARIAAALGLAQRRSRTRAARILAVAPVLGDPANAGLDAIVEGLRSVEREDLERVGLRRLRSFAESYDPTMAKLPPIESLIAWKKV